MSKVSVRGGFSDRYAIKVENTIIQTEDFDSRTRVQLQNLLSRLYASVYDNDLYYRRTHIQNYLKFVWGSVLSEKVDQRITYGDDKIITEINRIIAEGDYDDVLTLIEAIAQYWDRYLKKEKGYSYFNNQTKSYNNTSIYEYFNAFFKNEYVGYRFIEGRITPISDEFEKSAVEEALKNKYEPVTNHIYKANILLSDRDNPDYENSIKESICAVEAMCEIITGVRGKEATLSKMLKKLEDNGLVIHASLKEAFVKLYGYTSGSNGVRHAGDIGGPASTFEEAKFMLVSCCAFVNYLIAVRED